MAFIFFQPGEKGFEIIEMRAFVPNGNKADF